MSEPTAVGAPVTSPLDFDDCCEGGLGCETKHDDPGTVWMEGGKVQYKQDRVPDKTQFISVIASKARDDQPLTITLQTESWSFINIAELEALIERVKRVYA